MLEITIDDVEIFDENTSRFIKIPGTVLKLEHSLVSLYKWESKWKKPLISKEEMTLKQKIDYIMDMTITQNVNPILYNYISKVDLEKISDYINDPMTATTFSGNRNVTNREVITAEIIYYWMITFGIPFECQKWHLNKLLTLIKVCSIKNSPSKKMSKKDIYKNNAALNSLRRQNMNTTG